MQHQESVALLHDSWFLQVLDGRCDRRHGGGGRCMASRTRAVAASPRDTCEDSAQARGIALHEHAGMTRRSWESRTFISKEPPPHTLPSAVPKTVREDEEPLSTGSAAVPSVKGRSLARPDA